MANAKRDENHIPVAMWVSSVDGETPVSIEIHPTNWTLMCES